MRDWYCRLVQRRWKRSRTAFLHRPLYGTITGVADVDKIVEGRGSDVEAATNITGNIAWEGTLLSGNEPTEQHRPIKWEDVSTAKMQDKSTYLKHSAGI